jgi:hypothetical protein
LALVPRWLRGHPVSLAVWDVGHDVGGLLVDRLELVRCWTTAQDRLGRHVGSATSVVAGLSLLKPLLLLLWGFRRYLCRKELVFLPGNWGSPYGIFGAGGCSWV